MSEIFGLIFELKHRLMGWDLNCLAIHARFLSDQSQTDTHLNADTTIFTAMAINGFVFSSSLKIW